jgi:hypothetical protein
MLNMMTSYWISQAIYVAAKLGIADLVQNGSVRHETLAAASESDPPSLVSVAACARERGHLRRNVARLFRTHADG